MSDTPGRLIRITETRVWAVVMVVAAVVALVLVCQPFRYRFRFVRSQGLTGPNGYAGFDYPAAELALAVGLGVLLVGTIIVAAQAFGLFAPITAQLGRIRLAGALVTSLAVPLMLVWVIVVATDRHEFSINVCVALVLAVTAAGLAWRVRDVDARDEAPNTSAPAATTTNILTYAVGGAGVLVLALSPLPYYRAVGGAGSWETWASAWGSLRSTVGVLALVVGTVVVAVAASRPATANMRGLQVAGAVTSTVGLGFFVASWFTSWWPSRYTTETRHVGFYLLVLLAAAAAALSWYLSARSRTSASTAAALAEV